MILAQWLQGHQDKVNGYITSARKNEGANDCWFEWGGNPEVTGCYEKWPYYVGGTDDNLSQKWWVYKEENFWACLSRGWSGLTVLQKSNGAY